MPKIAAGTQQTVTIPANQQLFISGGIGTMTIGNPSGSARPTQEEGYDFEGAVVGPFPTAVSVLLRAFQDTTYNVVAAIDPATQAALQALVSGAGNTNLLSPSAISGLAYWFDAQAPMFTASYAKVCDTLGDSVAIWPSAHGSATPITLTPGGTTPTYDPAGINGKPAVKFAGNGYYTLANALSTAYNNAMTVFVVTKGNDISGNPVLLSAQPASLDFWMQAIAAGQLACRHQNLSAGTSSVTLNTGFTGIATLGVGATTLIQGMSTDTIEIWNTSGSAGGSQSTFQTTVTGGLGFSGTPTLYIGAVYPSGGSKYNGWIGEVLIYNAELTPTQIGLVQDYLWQKWFGQTSYWVTCLGNSHVSGTGSTSGATQATKPTGDNFPGLLWGQLGGTSRVISDAYPGRTLTQLIAESPSYSQVLRKPISAVKNVDVIWEATNSLNITQSARAAYDKLITLSQARRALGNRVIVTTCTPRGDAAYSGFEGSRQYFNNLVRANWRTFADGLADFAADSRLANPNDTTYFNADKLHFNSVGYGVAAQIAAAAVRTL